MVALTKQREIDKDYRKSLKRHVIYIEFVKLCLSNVAFISRIKSNQDI